MFQIGGQEPAPHSVKHQCSPTPTPSCFSDSRETKCKRVKPIKDSRRRGEALTTKTCFSLTVVLFEFCVFGVFVAVLVFRLHRSSPTRDGAPDRVQHRVLTTWNLLAFIWNSQIKEQYGFFFFFFLVALCSMQDCSTQTRETQAPTAGAQSLTQWPAREAPLYEVLDRK